jgi:tetratricopeptide (TPR) repeat protein
MRLIVAIKQKMLLQVRRLQFYSSMHDNDLYNISNDLHSIIIKRFFGSKVRKLKERFNKFRNEVKETKIKIIISPQKSIKKKIKVFFKKPKKVYKTIRRRLGILKVGALVKSKQNLSWVEDIRYSFDLVYYRKRRNEYRRIFKRLKRKVEKRAFAGKASSMKKTSTPKKTGSTSKKTGIASTEAKLIEDFQEQKARRALSEAFYKNYDVDKICDISAQWFPKYPKVPIYAAGYLLYRKEIYEDRKELIEFTNTLLDDFNHVALVMKIAADIYWEFGNKKDAIKLYERILKKSTNKTVIRETKKWKTSFYEDALKDFDILSLWIDSYHGTKIFRTKL